MCATGSASGSVYPSLLWDLLNMAHTMWHSVFISRSLHKCLLARACKLLKNCAHDECLYTCAQSFFSVQSFAVFSVKCCACCSWLSSCGRSPLTSGFCTSLLLEILSFLRNQPALNSFSGASFWLFQVHSCGGAHSDIFRQSLFAHFIIMYTARSVH